MRIAASRKAKKVDGSDCKGTREILDLYLDNELLVETNQSVLEHLGSCQNCAAESERRLELRRLLQTMSTDDADEVSAENALRRRIEAELHADRRRRIAANIRWALLAASLILFVGLGYWRITKRPTPPNSPAVNLPVSPPEAQLASMDSHAVGNHQACALTYPPDWKYDRQRIVRALTPRFASLVDLVGSNHRGSYELIEGHICSFQQRRYAHLIFRGNGHTVSVFIEEHQPLGEAGSSPPAEIAEAHYSKYEVASVDSGLDRIYLVSDLPSAENAALAKQLLPATLRFVQKMEHDGVLRL